jgi:ectoine hydroxylase-related dioxygenase (phytanoyl-CoA dioxygenase family)
MRDELGPLRAVTEEERETYRAEGVVVLKGVLPPSWIERMRAAVDRILAAPSAAAVEYAPAGQGRYLGDFFVWMRDPDFEAFALRSPMGALARQLIGARDLTFFYDQLLVKEPMTREETPWHQDLPYWPLKGEDIVSLWVGFDPVPPEAGAMRYMAGSHKQGVMYAPRAFSKDSGFAELYARMGLPPFPDSSGFLESPKLRVCAVEPGDVIAHHPLTFHWSPGNLHPTRRRRALALRYLGDDAVFDARPGTFVENDRVKGLLREPIAHRDGDRLGGLNFPRVD